ncbi:hypothetical protein [Agromyces bauzanensis]
MTISWRLVALCLSIAVGGMLAGCTVDSASPSSGSGRPAAEASGVPKAEEEPVPATVEPVIVVASVDVDGAHASASGYVAGVVEDGGACSFTFTALERTGTVVADTVGAADRANTSCGMVSEDIAEFTRGTWEVRLSYTALDGAVSESDAARLEVP